MSITFSTEYSESIVRVHCACGKAYNDTLFESYSKARAAVNTYSVEIPSCGDDFCEVDFPSIRDLVEVPSINMSNFNAEEILTLLGLADFTGVLAAEDFKGRILMALAIQPADAGVPAIQDGNVVSCGRPEGYFQFRLLELEELADYAIQRELAISWA